MKRPFLTPRTPPVKGGATNGLKSLLVGPNILGGVCIFSLEKRTKSEWAGTNVQPGLMAKAARWPLI